MMGRLSLSIIIGLSLCLSLCSFPVAEAQLRKNFYANVCPNVESIVRKSITKKFKQTFVTAPAVVRLIFHDCFVRGCDASILIASTPNNQAEKDHPDNLSLAGDGFDAINKAKAAVDATPGCKNKVSCADILVMAARDLIALTGGPSYAVELGRLDGLISTAASVNGKLPEPSFNLDQLNQIFAANGLSQNDMIALSACHTVGFSHCDRFQNRIFNFSKTNPVDPTLNSQYASQLQQACPIGVESDIVVFMDPTTPKKFDNVYFKNLQQGKGLFSSDQILFTDPRSKATVTALASNPKAFNQAFITAMTNLARVGVKTTPGSGNIRRVCGAFN